MATELAFGGAWTKEKLDRVRKYLPAYTTIFHGNPYARTHYQTMYIDAFAGTGYVTPNRRRSPNPEQPSGASSLFDFLSDPESPEATAPVVEIASVEAKEFLKGSARIALEVDPPFDRYVFIEKSKSHSDELRKLALEFPDRANRIDITTGAASVTLLDLIERTNWRQWRSVVFLDPYGAQVEWSLIEAIAGTKAIDLWLLFPIGMAVNRLLTRDQPPPEAWAATLTRIFGTEDWREEFYQSSREAGQMLSLFADDEDSDNVEDSLVKTASFDRIAAFFAQRLREVFAEVAPNPLPLLSSTNVPLYLLCFASDNKAAVKIAKHILSQ